MSTNQRVKVSNSYPRGAILTLFYELRQRHIQIAIKIEGYQAFPTVRP